MPSAARESTSEPPSQGIGNIVASYRQKSLSGGDPLGDPNLLGDPYSTLFVARLSHQTTEHTLRKDAGKGKKLHQKETLSIVTAIAIRTVKIVHLKRHEARLKLRRLLGDLRLRFSRIERGLRLQHFALRLRLEAFEALA
ncbi:hypothetical protein L484_018925 [Morus notabilis]|uniref:Uncharacterized protein n=1 Tax=Morus notabilis TaxID=981085 RepID=W9QRA3_9ROSA|nr:hypothetical protein L484_018925 [Morus notabilis]